MMALSFIHDSAPKGLSGVELAQRQLHAGIMRESLQGVLSSEAGKLKNQNNNNINNASVLHNFPALLGSPIFPGSPLMNPLLINPSSPNVFSNQLFSLTPPHSTKKRSAKSQPVVSSTNQINEHNNNNPRSKGKLKDEVREEIPSAPLSPPTSGSSPQSNGSNGSAEVGSSVGRPSSSLDSRDKVFTCGICNRSFGYKHVLQNHERTHTGEKPFECPQCQKRFTRDHHLKTHMRLHTGEKPYRCDHCDRNFVQVANLRRHLRVHTGERPYACELCSSRFSDSNQLKAHMLIHKGEKPFECGLCRGKFRRRHHLMHHKCPCPRSADSTHFLLGKTEIGIDEEMLTDFEKDDDDEERLIGYNNNSVSLESKKIRERKSRDIRRVIRFPPSPSPPVPPQMILPSLVLPEQTEPEDLSVRGRATSRSLNQNSNSNSSLGDSPRSATPPSDEDMEPDTRLEYLHPKFRRHFLTTSQSS